MPLSGKHCAIVGATGTIGTAIARAFASHGAVVTLLGRSAVSQRAKLEPLLVPARDTTPSRHRFIRLDVADRHGIKDVFGKGNVRTPSVCDLPANIDREMTLSETLMCWSTARVFRRRRC